MLRRLYTDGAREVEKEEEKSAVTCEVAATRAEAVEAHRTVDVLNRIASVKGIVARTVSMRV